MKKIIALLLAVAVIFSLASCGGSMMTMGTGGTAGTYYGYGGILGNQIKQTTGININVVSTDGSKANIIGIDSDNYQLGTVQSDVMSYAWAGTRSFEADGAIKSFRVIGGLYAEAVQLVTSDPNIKSVADLKGKKVSIGAPGSGVYFNAIDILNAAGLTENDIIPQYQSFADSADNLTNRKIDAAFVVAGAPTPAIQELYTNGKAHLIDISGEVASTLLQASPFYSVYKIPAGTYSGQTEEITTVTVKATLIVSANASEEDVYNITKAIFDNIDSITAAHAKGAELSLENATEGITVPFHKGAAKYFAEKNITVVSE
ncbi:MAG: TAXI family TRAP transporter solute-binding subunit [Clostridia bacterium]|nr:TAXI family TRAP transporter solute-binding subunit [Clostridia bacterium]